MEKTYTTLSASKIIGCCDRTVLKHIYSGKLRAKKVNGEWIIPKIELDRYIFKYGKQEQLCAKCANACGGCRWSDDLLPVEGWDAEPTKVYIDSGTPMDSFLVKSCPMFKPDGPRHVKSLTDDAFYRLIYAMLFELVREYAHSYKTFMIDHRERTIAWIKMDEIERYVKTPMFDEMLGVMKLPIDGPKLLEMIRSDPLGVIQRVGRMGEYQRTTKGENEYDDDYQDN